MPTSTFIQLYTELAARLNDPSNTLWTLAQIKRYVNGAVTWWDAHGGYWVVVDQTSIVPVSNQLTYPLPTAITNPRQILRILKRTSSKTDQATVDIATNSYSAASSTPISEPWSDFNAARIVFHNGQGRLLLYDFLMTTDTIAIMYKQDHGALISDTDSTDVPPDVIYSYGRYLAHNEMAGKVSEQDRKYHLEEREAAWREANDLIGPAMRQMNPDVVLKQNNAVLADW